MIPVLLSFVLAFGQVLQQAQPQSLSPKPGGTPSSSNAGGGLNPNPNNAAPPAKPVTSPARSAVELEAPVITIRGICKGKENDKSNDKSQPRSAEAGEAKEAKSSENCQTIVTREQF